MSKHAFFSSKRFKEQLIGAVAVGHTDEKPNPRPRKEMREILEYRD